MKLDLLKPFERLPYFTIEGCKQLLDVDEDGNQRVREMLSRWSKGGHILRLKKGVYMTRRFYDLHRHESDFLPAVSNILLPQSYLSLEYVLQRAGMLTAITYSMTAVTTKNTRTIENIFGTFIFRHIQPDYYTSFTHHEYHGIVYGFASLAKALFDYLYQRPFPRRLRTHLVSLAEDLRLNLDECTPEFQEEFEGYVVSSRSAKMAFILENLRRAVWQP